MFVLSQIECEPGHPTSEECTYQVAWSINPHMRVGTVDVGRARAQHRALRELIASRAEVLELPFLHGAYDSVFTKDPAVLVEHRGVRRALLASPPHPERRAEQAGRASFFEQNGFLVVPPPSVHWEGGDVVVLPGGEGAFLGHGHRSEPGAAAWLERYMGVPVLPLELRDPYLFHLDMALAVLPDNTVLVCEEALTPSSVETLRSEYLEGDVVPVPREVALSFGLNLLPVNDAVVMGASVPFVEQIVRARGLEPIVTPLGEFHLAGGGVACLVTRLHRDMYASLELGAQMPPSSRSPSSLSAPPGRIGGA